MKRALYLLACVLVLVGLLGVVSCSSKPTATTPITTVPPIGNTNIPAAAAVVIQGFAFSPDTVTIGVGGTVTWTNKDSVNHTVTANDGSFDSGALANGSNFSHTFTAAGTYDYHCSIHPSMVGHVVVK